MHLEELFQCIEQNRRRFMAKRNANIRLAGENNGENSANDEIEPVLVEVGAGELSDIRD